MDSEFRQLEAREKGLLEKLLEVEFPGRDELCAQLNSLTAKQLMEDGTLKLRCASGSASPSYDLLPAEGWCKDADGMNICVLLHLNREGFMSVLEIFKDDGSDIIDPPAPDRMMVLLPEHGGYKPGEVQVSR